LHKHWGEGDQDFYDTMDLMVRVVLAMFRTAHLLFLFFLVFCLKITIKKLKLFSSSLSSPKRKTKQLQHQELHKFLSMACKESAIMIKKVLEYIQLPNETLPDDPLESSPAPVDLLCSTSSPAKAAIAAMAIPSSWTGTVADAKTDAQAPVADTPTDAPENRKTPPPEESKQDPPACELFPSDDAFPEVGSLFESQSHVSPASPSPMMVLRIQVPFLSRRSTPAIDTRIDTKQSIPESNPSSANSRIALITAANQFVPAEAMKATQQPMKAMKAIQQPMKAMKAIQQPMKAMKAIQQPMKAMKAIQQPMKAKKAIKQPIKTLPPGWVAIDKECKGFSYQYLSVAVFYFALDFGPSNIV